MVKPGRPGGEAWHLLSLPAHAHATSQKHPWKSRCGWNAGKLDGELGLRRVSSHATVRDRWRRRQPEPRPARGVAALVGGDLTRGLVVAFGHRQRERVLAAVCVRVHHRDSAMDTSGAGHTALALRARADGADLDAVSGVVCLVLDDGRMLRVCDPRSTRPSLNEDKQKMGAAR